MTIYWSATHKGFYSDGIHLKRNLPADAEAITDEEHRNLLAAQSLGSRIVVGTNGRPVAIARHPLGEEPAKELLRQRNQALTETDALVARHRDEIEMGTQTTLTPEQYLSLQVWRAQLRRLPEHPQFPNIEFPAETRVTVQELLDLIFQAKRLEDLQSTVRNKLIQELVSKQSPRSSVTGRAFPGS